MDLSAREILKVSFDKYVKKLAPSLSFEEAEGESGYNWIYEAMKQYAEQEAKFYASWLSNQVIAGRTSVKLWSDYQKEIGEL